MGNQAGDLASAALAQTQTRPWRGVTACHSHAHPLWGHVPASTSVPRCVVGCVGCATHFVNM